MIDLMSNHVMTSAQINRRAQFKIQEKWPEFLEKNLQRKLHGKALGSRPTSIKEDADIVKYQTELEVVESVTAQDRIDNKLLEDALDYENAEKKLARFIVSQGRSEQIIYKNVIDPVTQLSTQVVSSIIPGIDPVSAKIVVPNHDSNGIYLKDILIENPAITKDLQERSVSQQVIDNSSQQVIDLVALRKSKI